MRTHCGVRKQSGHLESATLFADHCGSECCCQLYISSENKKKRGGEISEPLGAPCKTRNQCSVYSPLKLAHIEEEGFGHVNANLSAISMFFFGCTGVFLSIWHEFLAGKRNGRGIDQRGRGLCLPPPTPLHSCCCKVHAHSFVEKRSYVADQSEETQDSYNV